MKDGHSAGNRMLCLFASSDERWICWVIVWREESVGYFLIIRAHDVSSVVETRTQRWVEVGFVQRHSRRVLQLPFQIPLWTTDTRNPNLQQALIPYSNLHIVADVFSITFNFTRKAIIATVKADPNATRLRRVFFSLQDFISLVAAFQSWTSVINFPLVTISLQ